MSTSQPSYTKARNAWDVYYALAKLDGSSSEVKDLYNTYLKLHKEWLDALWAQTAVEVQSRRLPALENLRGRRSSMSLTVPEEADPTRETLAGTEAKL